ncbi:hypothetical protein L7F22_044202 [Adiantum nelumboides]|nr:hypothetical protein [Adiantum nelumboides]
MRSQTILATFMAFMALMVSQADGLYFYLNPKETQCFYEELPADTVVVGHYMAETWDKEKHIFHINEDLGINIVVREVKEEHLVTSTLGPAEGKFAFTSHEAGDHSICLSTRLTTNEAAKLPMDEHHHQVRMHLDIIIGEAKPDNSHADRAHIRDLASRVQELNDKLRDIRKEQQFQREREVDFRNASEKTNSRALFWSVVQAVVLVGTCAWQATHLRVSITFCDWDLATLWPMHHLLKESIYQSQSSTLFKLYLLIILYLLFSSTDLLRPQKDSMRTAIF